MSRSVALTSVVNLQVEDLDDVEDVVEPIGLGVVAGQAIEDQRVLPGQEQLLHLEDLDVPLPDPDGEVVGHQAPCDV